MALLDKSHKVEKNKNLKTSFIHAYEGIKYSAVKEKNFRIHLIVASFVIVFGALLSISYFEWLICLILIALVISLELLNTAIESVVDMITTKENDYAKTAKDAAAGAVLVVSIVSAFIGIIIFLPKIFDLLINL